MGSKPTRLEILKKQQDQLKAKIQALEASEFSRERKRETRRKILVGAYYLDKMRADNKFNELVSFMDSYLSRDSDRVLFNLPPNEKNKSKEASE